MKKTTTILTTTLFIVASLLPSATVFAETFNPNNILSDEELQHWESMNRADIQAFLEEQDSFLTHYRAEDVDGDTRLASDIIYRAAKEHQINPKYLLVKLQKEQSLITTDDPSDKQLDGATGYGISDGCGWDCAVYKRNKGFGKQVDSAAAIMRWYYDHYYNESWIKKMNVAYTIDSERVTPENKATAFLYTYTPHLQGNKNFWKLWDQWFAQQYPDGTLVQATGDNTVYILRDGKKHAFATMSALTSRFDPKRVVTIPKSELVNYPEGSAITLPNYAILHDGNTHYLLDYDTLRPFKNEAVLRELGYNPGEIITVDEDDLSGYDIGKTITADTSPITTLVNIEETDQLYTIKDGIYHEIIDPRIAAANYPNLKPQTIPISELRHYEAGEAEKLKDGTIFGIEGGNKIYVVEKGKKRHIANEQVFNTIGYDWSNIVWVNQYVDFIHKTAQPVFVDITTSPTTEEKTTTVVEKTKETETASSESSDEKKTLVDHMVRTPADELSFIGPEYNTTIDGYLIADAQTGDILAGKNIDTVRPLASLTKTVTAYRLLKEGLRPAKSTSYDSQDHAARYHYYRIANGERVLNSDLLDAGLVSSLNAPMRMLVSNVSEDEDAFIERMNTQAAEWGLTDTTFTSVTGEDEFTVSTAREYLVTLMHTLRNTTVATHLGNESYSYDELTDTDGSPHHRANHSNRLVGRDNLGYRIIASKTGFLYESGTNLAMLVERPRDKKRFIVLTMGNPDFNAYSRFDEPHALTQWALDNL